ncbi:hypothetical protein L323_04155 [Ruminiclostridium papyrosolvens C7]|uniref:Uncharacterized protein n=1 Tax=Ruminiclostridium papyrosolvens C7 TaxID=1330534 RepID=U4R6A0_9FIRM|nr:hypothetical protein L323_04155 [Ruminiclostridium papyrosolvens C7]
MGYLSILEVKNQTIELYKKLHQSHDLHSFICFGSTYEDCMPYVDIDNKGYHIKCYERGKLIQDNVTSSIDELLC